MAKKVLSILIGSEITKVCEVSYRKKYRKHNIHVYKSITFPTPENTIEDGYIKDKIAFSNQLLMELKQQKIRTKKVIFSISSSKIANREVILPFVKESRIKDIIKIGASDYFPIDIKDYILSYIILEKRKSDRKEKVFEKKQEKLEKKLAKKQKNKDQKDIKKQRDRSSNIVRPKKIRSYKMMFNEDAHTLDTAEDLELQTKKLDDKIKKSQKQIRLSVYAVPSNLVKNYYNFAAISGLEILSIDYSGNSGYQMLKRQSNEGTNVFVQLNEQDTVISILREDILFLQRTVGYGISTLMDTVIDQKCYNLNNSNEVMEFLRSRDLLSHEPKPIVYKDVMAAELEAAVTEEEIGTSNVMKRRNQEELARKNILESLNFLTSSISRMLDYYKNNNKNVLFQSIYLSGYGIRLRGIDQMFTREIGIPNKKLEKLATVSAKKKAQAYRNNPSEFMACVGAVIHPVDFVPTELIERKEKIRSILLIILLMAVSLGAAGYLCYNSYTNYLTEQKVYDMAAERLEKIPQTSGVTETYEKVKAELEDLQKMEAVMKSERDINEVLSELEKKLPTNSIIQSMQFSDTGVVMNISMADNNHGANSLVAKLLMQLKTVELFADVQDSNMSVSEDGQISITITCTY